MKSLVAALSILVSLSLDSCTVMPPDAAFGPLPTDYRQTIPARMASVLPNSWATQYRFSEPTKIWVTPIFNPHPTAEWAGYEVHFYVREPNGRGGYGSDQEWRAEIHNGVVEKVEPYSPPPP